MTKPEAEKYIRWACQEWRRTEAVGIEPLDLHFSQFRRWLLARKPDALDFRARGGADYIAELWFDQEMNLTWTR
ncbi:MAG: hypothetical protein ABT14_18335 [Pelagibacterium sp. SCN 63-17]|nr:MAG: hypothetical protein ABT14_18335 [Pelagibacterium sp. SCN 63-17]